MEIDRNTLWKPVGLDLTGSQSVEEALNRAELNFDVDKQKIYLNKGGMKVIPNQFANVRSDNGMVLGIVTGKYKIVQNRDAFDFVDNLIADGVQFEKGGVFHCGRAAWLEALIPEDYSILGDKVESHVVFVNSHDGKGAVKVAIIPNRIACSNALNFALKGAKRMWSVVHSTKVDERIEDARLTLGLADKYMKELSKEAEMLAMKKMDDHEFLEIINKIYPVDEDNSNRRLTNVAEIKDGLMYCLKADDLANFKGTAWEKLGAVTDFFDHREAQRKTATFAEERFKDAISGQKDVDKFYQAILSA